MMSLNHTARITLDGDFSILALTKAYKKKKTLTKNKDNALAFFFFRVVVPPFLLHAARRLIAGLDLESAEWALPEFRELLSVIPTVNLSS